MRRIRTTAGLLTVLFLAGCSPGSPPAIPPTTPPVSTRPSSAPPATTFPSTFETGARRPTRPAPRLDRAQLTALLVRASDLPSSWHSRGHVTADAPGGDADQAMARCVGTRRPDRDRISLLFSGNFDHDSADVTSLLTSYRTEGGVDAVKALWLSPAAPACYRRYASHGGIDAPGQRISVKPCVVTPRAAAQPVSVIANVDLSFTLTDRHSSDIIYVDDVLIRGPGLVITATFINTGARVPARVQAHVVSRIAARITAAGR